MAPFTRQEVEKAISQMFPTKAPRFDGSPALFYQKYWKIVGANTIDNCLDILNNGGEINSWNYTNIVLIPKINNSTTVGITDRLAYAMSNTKLLQRP